MRKQRIGLEDHRDIALIGGQHGDILAADQDTAGGGMLQPRQHAQGRGLAAAGRAEQRDQRAGLDREREIVNGREIAELLFDIGEDDGAGAMGGHDAAFSCGAAEGTKAVATRFSRRSFRSPTRSWKQVMMTIMTTISIEE